MTKAAEITVVFKALRKVFKRIKNQPADHNMNRMFEELAKILYPIRFDVEKGKHNLTGLIMENADYVLKYSKSFSRPICPTIYGKLKDTLVGVPRVRAEATHNALLADRGLYDTAERETGLFILWAVDNVWLSNISKRIPTYYSEVFAKTMLDHLQELCLGNHKVDILVLVDKMRQMHNTST